MSASCTRVSAACPVEATVLGYYPNLGSSIFFTTAFGLCLVAAATLAARTRTWTYGAAIVVALVLETAGYVGRILLHANPWDSGAFQLQICTIILGPTFVCASLYLTLKHVALALGPKLSRIPPAWLPRIFLPADFACLVVQAIGGGVAAAGAGDAALLERGNRTIIAGVALQVVVLVLFGLLAGDYALRVRRALRRPGSSPAVLAVWRDAGFRKFIFGVVGAYIAILIRCAYRIAEMQGGWASPIMQDQTSFLVLDSTLVLVAVSLLTIFHPGLLFPQMRKGAHRKSAAAHDVESREAKANETSDSSNEDGHLPVAVS